MYRKTKSLALVAVLIIQLACGGGDLIRSFRAALGAATPLVDSLVASGALPQSKATEILRDFDDGAVCAGNLQNAFSRIQKGDPDERSRKFEASSQGLQCFRTIIDRHNFAAHPRVQQAVSIAEGILASLTAYYSTSSIGPTAAARPSEEVMQKRLKAKIDELNEALKP